MNIAALGRTRMLYDSIKTLVEQGHDVPIIITCPAQPEYEVGPDDFESLASEINAEFYEKRNINKSKIVERFDELDCELAVSVNWISVLSEETLAVFEHGILNAHAGDLPRYRGNAAPNWAIINGETEIGITIHEMDVELDAGPIFTQEKISIDDETTIGEVYEFMYSTVPDLFAEVVERIATGNIEPEPQPDEETLRAYPRKPKDSELNWELPAEQLDRIVRASSEPFFGAFTYIGTQKLRVWDTHVEHPSFEYLGTPGQVAEIRSEDGEVAVITGDGFLVLEEVQIEGGKRCVATEVVDSARTRMGMDMQGEIQNLHERLSALENDQDT